MLFYVDFQNPVQIYGQKNLLSKFFSDFFTFYCIFCIFGVFLARIFGFRMQRYSKKCPPRKDEKKKRKANKKKCEISINTCAFQKFVVPLQPK